jgi:hypothetical protein
MSNDSKKMALYGPLNMLLYGVSYTSNVLLACMNKKKRKKKKHQWSYGKIGLLGLSDKKFGFHMQNS